jgi:NADH-quinone oxidoreductase subunit G
VAGTVEALRSAEFVIALSPYSTAKEFAHLILPIGSFAETSGTYVNLEGRWQSVPGAAKPVGDSRPGWKVLRVLGNLLNLPGFEYTSSDQVTDELRRQIEAASAATVQPSARTLQAKRQSAQASVPEVALYGVDALVRRSPALQSTPEALREQGQEQGK